MAVILSAQCTDKRVNMTTPGAVRGVSHAPSIWPRPRPRIFIPYIKSISYPNNKARNLAGMARMLCGVRRRSPERPGADAASAGRGPQDGQRAGAVLWQKEVMPVDTHVFRVSNRIGLTTRSKTPLQTELTLERTFLAICCRWPTTG